MQATLIYNTNAGNANDLSIDELKGMLLDAGFRPVYKATDSEDDLDAALKNVKGLVVVAGGDGTIRAAALRLIGRRNVTLAPLPMGTANNIGHTFGIKDMQPAEIIAGLRDGVEKAMDVGRISGPFPTEYFLEGFGCGVFADVMATYDPEEGKSVTRAIRTLVKVLPGYEPRRLKVWMDGQYVGGEYIMLEVLNTERTGPRLTIAPDADPCDGLLDMVGVLDSERHGMLSYVRRVIKGELGELPNVINTRSKRLRLHWTGFPLHIDGIVKGSPDPANVRPAEPLTIEVLPGALHIYLPAMVSGDEIPATEVALPEAQAVPPAEPEVIANAVEQPGGVAHPDTMRLDLHCHSEASHDCVTPIAQFPQRLLDRGINVQAITDHDQIWGAQKLKEMVESRPEWRERLTIIIGEEISTTEGEIIGLFLTEVIPPRLSPEETIARIKSQGGLVSLPHGFDPLKRHRLKPDAFRRVADQFDIVEGFNARISNRKWNEAASKYAADHKLMIACGTDAHTWQDIGCAASEAPYRAIHGPADLVAALATSKIEGTWTHPVPAFINKMVYKVRRRLGWA
jgi:diacylglycerol kinase (ATP)